jgi:uncharacterized SAM-binding protein YcdF (DUF218 family)
MKRLATWLVGILGTVVWVFAFGFILFAVNVMRVPEETTAKADGIIVLTGGQLRIKAGMRLLEEGRGRRLLITGVYRRTGKSDIARASGISEADLKCCVDLGYEALNTRGNADEASAWARKYGFKSLIVVTSSYHMPRSLIELTSKMPGVVLIPHAVVPDRFRRGEWWLDAHTTRVLLSEYIKLFPAAVRLVAVRSHILGDGPSGSRAAHSTGPL